MPNNMTREAALKALAEIVASPREDDQLLERPAIIGKSLMIGNMEHASEIFEKGDDSWLSPSKISGIVSCLRNQGFMNKECAKLSEKVAFLNIEEDDAPGAPILGQAPSWERAHAVAAFVREHADEDRRVLVHCMEGRNRSAAHVVATLMLNERYYLLDAVEELWAKRPFVLQNESFREFLVQLAEQEQLLGRGSILDAVCILKPRHINIGQKLGAGDFGAVYRGSWRGIKMALKFCEPEASDELQRECALMDSLEHPNIVMTYGICVGSSPEWWPAEVKPPCLCCEILSGGNLLQYVQKHQEEQYGKWHWKVVLGMLVGAASGLSYLHSQGVMHRDLKSENILLDDSLNAKIADFGLSKVKQCRSDRRHTVSIGTFTHMAPEVMSGTYYLSCDVFSFGITVTEVLTATQADDIIEQTRTGDFGLNKKGLLEFLNRELHPFACFELADVAAACCEKDNEKRPVAENVRELLTNVENAASKERSLTCASAELPSIRDDINLKGRILEHHPEDVQKAYRIRFADGLSYWFTETAIQASQEIPSDSTGEVYEEAKRRHTQKRRTLLGSVDGDVAASWTRNIRACSISHDVEKEDSSVSGDEVDVVEATHVVGVVGRMSQTE